MISLRVMDSISGAVRYYSSGHGEGTGAAELTWAGRGAEIAGLSGEAEQRDLINVLAGVLTNPETGDEQRLGRMVRDPETGEIERVYRPGIDLTFSPPKSFSMVALAGDDQQLAAAVVLAARETMDWLEREVAQTRLTTAGTTQNVKTSNLLYASTVHETNRKGEPQLHVHVLVSSATWSEQRDRWGSLAERSLFRQRKAADGVFKERLAEHARGLGYKIEQTRNGPEIGGFRRQDIAAFAQRTTQIERQYDRMMERNGWTHDSRQAKELAVKDTRDPKRNVGHDELRDSWRATAQRHGIDIEHVVQQARDRRDGRAIEHERSPSRDRDTRAR